MVKIQFMKCCWPSIRIHFRTLPAALYTGQGCKSMLSIGEDDSAKLIIFCHFSRLGGSFSKFDTPARLPKFLPTTVKCN